MCSAPSIQGFLPSCMPRNCSLSLFEPTEQNMLEVILPGPQDPLSLLKKAADEDKSPQKVDVGVGVYRNEDGKYQELETLKWVRVPDTDTIWPGRSLHDRPKQSSTVLTWATM